MPLIQHQTAWFPAAGLTVYVYDTFSTSSGNMAVRDPDPVSAGHLWVEQKRNWICTAVDHCRMNESADGQLVVDSGVGNCTVEGDALHRSGQPSVDGGLLLRSIGLNDCLYLLLDYAASPQVMKLYDFANGPVATSSTITVSDDTWYHLKAVMLNDNIKGYLDGVQLIDYTLSGSEYARFTTAKTSHGFSSGNADAWIFDEFKVSA